MNERLAMPTKDEIAAESDTVRRSILEAMRRILTGQPLRIRPGAASISQLALEAGVGRHHLYQRYPDLRARYERLRDGVDQRTSHEIELQRRLDKGQAEIRRLTELQARTWSDAQQWKGLVDTLQRAINVLQEELRSEQIRSQRLERRLAKRHAQESATPVVDLRAVRSPKQSGG